MESNLTSEDDVEIHDPLSFDFDLIIGCIEDAVISKSRCYDLTPSHNDVIQRS